MTEDTARHESTRGGWFDIFAGLLLFGMVLWGCTVGVRDDRAATSPDRDVPAVVAPEPREPAVGDSDSGAADDTPEPVAEDPAEVDDPFTVDVSIEDFDDPQSGWLKIGAQSSPGQVSTAHGRFTGTNEFYLKTDNVSAFTVNLAALPERPATRLTVHLDGQNLVVFPRSGALTFTRDKTGQWVLLKR